jgi:hypothetical protein
MEQVKPFVPYLVYFFGAGLGIVVPYVRKWLAEGVAFDWQQVAGKAFAAVLGILLMPTFNETLQSLGGMGVALSFLAGLGATMAGHEVQSVPAAIRGGQRRGVL